MGIERDFLMRQLMMLFAVIEKMIRLRKKGENEDAQEEIDYFYKCLNLEADFSMMNIEELFEFLVNEKKLTNEHIEMIAFVLSEQGELSNQEEKSHNFFCKALFLLDKVERESTTFSMTRQMKMAELKGLIGNQQ